MSARNTLTQNSFCWVIPQAEGSQSGTREANEMQTFMATYSWLPFSVRRSPRLGLPRVDGQRQTCPKLSSWRNERHEEILQDKTKSCYGSPSPYLSEPDEKYSSIASA